MEAWFLLIPFLRRSQNLCNFLRVNLFVFRPISTGNVGRQMLEKMGWKEGEGLGREGAGRREPVSVQF